MGGSIAWEQLAHPVHRANEGLSPDSVRERIMRYAGRHAMPVRTKPSLLRGRFNAFFSQKIHWVVCARTHLGKIVHLF